MEQPREKWPAIRGGAFRFHAVAQAGLVLLVWGTSWQQIPAQPSGRSHPPLRPAPPPADRPMEHRPGHFVDPVRGDDQQAGTEKAPWKTIRKALTRLKAGETLYLRGGVYYENVAVRLAGRPEAPITIRSYPREQAILDGGLPEFLVQPAAAWAPYPQGGAGEYRSTKTYPNLRNVVGSFGDSMIGLHTYYHAQDLRAGSEVIAQKPDKSDVQPLYCGPGLWYDRDSGHLHIRLAPTQVPGLDNYRGETDPRKLPLVLAPFRSVPLHLDRAAHVRLQDLVVRGGGHDTILMDQSSDVEFDNVTVWCGTFGLRATGTQRLKFHRSALYGNIPPWCTRFETGFNTYPGRTTRDITRLNTHALLLAGANREFDVYCYPFNDDWEISHSEFTDAADGLYLGGVNVKFHHNLVARMQDDGLYLSPMYPRHHYLRNGARLEIHQNYFTRCLTLFAFGGTEETKDVIYLYRNVIDLREPLPARPSEKQKAVSPYAGQVMGDHGGPPWPAMFTYHNTFVVSSPAREPSFGAARGTLDKPRRVFNNLFLHLGKLPGYAAPNPAITHTDGNLYWQPGLTADQAAVFFKAYRAGPAFAASKKAYPPGLDAGSLVLDPKLTRAAADPKSQLDYRLQPGSPAVNAGVTLPQDWPDPLRPGDKGRPDIGAVPLGAGALPVGRGMAVPRLKR